jgi:hypothetical protein
VDVNGFRRAASTARLVCEFALQTVPGVAEVFPGGFENNINRSFENAVL